MRILPVIDLKSGVVVRGVAGRRDEYQPVQSVLASDARPQTVAEAFVRKLGLRELYLADLDAIAGEPPAWDVYRQLLDMQVDLYVDAGIDNLGRAGELAAFCSGGRPLAGVVAGLESLREVEMLPALVELLGPRRLIFSLDLKAARPLTPITRWRELPPEQIATEAIGYGVRRLIVLDLAQVGMGQGASVGCLCRAIRQLDPKLELITGGGIRNSADVALLAAAGCDAVLVASALHDGAILAGS